jgi:hypothetical protein
MLYLPFVSHNIGIILRYGTSWISLALFCLPVYLRTLPFTRLIPTINLAMNSMIESGKNLPMRSLSVLLSISRSLGHDEETVTAAKLISEVVLKDQYR